MKRICDLNKHTCIVNVYVMNIRNGIWYVMYKERYECKAYICNVWMEDVCIYGIYGHICLCCINVNGKCVCYKRALDTCDYICIYDIKVKER